MRSTLFLSLWVLVLSFSANGEDATEALSQLLLPMKTLTGHFKQYSTDSEGEVFQPSEGLFALKRPGKFRWDTLEPGPQLLVSNQKKLWLYDAELNVVTVRPFDERLQQTPILLLSGEVSKIRRHFQVVQSSPEKNKQVFTLHPRAKTGMYEQLQLRFALGQLKGMSVRDSLGQTTTITLNNLELNKALEDQQFEFQPPPGADVMIDE